jgi:hypothetical protein
VFAGSPAVIGGGRILPSPSSFYVTGEDNLRIVSVNAVVGVSLKLQWRLADSRGVAVPNSVDHTPNTDRTLRHEEYTLGVGQLLNVTVFASAGSPNIGQTYVLVQLVRGSGSAAIVLGTLLGGYVTTTQALGFPGSPIVSSTSAEPAVRLINGTTPPAGVDFSEQCPTGARWQLLSLAAKLQTSAVAATRSPALWFARGTSVGATYIPVSTVGATEIWRLCWASGSGSGGTSVSFTAHTGIGAQQLLTGGDYFQSVVTGMQAGDQWSAVVYYVREWLEVP